MNIDRWQMASSHGEHRICVCWAASVKIQDELRLHQADTIYSEVFSFHEKLNSGFPISVPSERKHLSLFQWSVRIWFHIQTGDSLIIRVLYYNVDLSYISYWFSNSVIYMYSPPKKEEIPPPHPLPSKNTHIENKRFFSNLSSNFLVLPVITKKLKID